MTAQYLIMDPDLFLTAAPDFDSSLRNRRYNLRTKLGSNSLSTSRSSKHAYKLIIGALAYSQQKYGMRICYPVSMTNHAHWLYIPDSHTQACDFFRLAHSQISREIGKEIGWSGGIFKERYSSTVDTDEPKAQWERLKYLVSQGVKEGLVKLPEQWPGPNGAMAYLDGSMAMEGIWVDRTSFDAAMRKYNRQVKANAILRQLRRPIKRIIKPQVRDFEHVMFLQLSTIPAWENFGPSEIVENFEALRQDVLEENWEIRATVRPDWKRRLTDKSQRSRRPARTKRGKKPKFHAASKQTWLLYVKNWENWLTQYSRAAKRLRRGIVEALGEFPANCFLPTSIGPQGSLLEFARPPTRELAR